MPKPLYPHNVPTFFIDRSLGGKIIPSLLKQDNWQIIRHDDHFTQATPDTEWIKTVAKKKWIILTADNRICYKQAEIECIKRHKAIAFTLINRKDLTGSQIAAIFIALKEKIYRAAIQATPPTIYKILPSEKRLIKWV